MVTIKFEFGSIAEAAAFMVRTTTEGMTIVSATDVPLPVATIAVTPTPTEAPKEKKPRATPAPSSSADQTPTDAPTPAPTPAPAASSPTTAAASDAPNQSALDYNRDVKPAFLKLVSVKGRDAAVALVKGFGFKANLQEAKPEQYADIVAAIEAQING